jgi:hypothetical protein
MGYHSVLLDTETKIVLGRDHGEPEDNSFSRDYQWIVELLNEQAVRIKELENENAELSAAVMSPTESEESK